MKPCLSPAAWFWIPYLIAIAIAATWLAALLELLP